ncbi:hypothetical protein NDU88_006417 [Pleurodeles waltl]|uniref:Uncharacterized protein n=1 Tax=Pleurodeles waltl TaxID=8319 RepID=A0AAV7SPQ2_PLEWA|nr:hypothetical protein NDU88_006417 [Pleurodeles waltl]
MHHSILPPPVFTPDPASSESDCELWKEGFEAYLDALDGDSFTHKKKFDILRHCLGSEGRKILKHIPQVDVPLAEGEGDGGIDEYSSAIKCLDVRFKACKNVIMERHKFYKRVHISGESVASFVGALRILAVSCDYKACEDEMIRDKLVENTNNRKGEDVLGLYFWARAVESRACCRNSRHETQHKGNGDAVRGTVGGSRAGKTCYLYRPANSINLP